MGQHFLLHRDLVAATAVHHAEYAYLSNDLQRDLVVVSPQYLRLYRIEPFRSCSGTSDDDAAALAVPKGQVLQLLASFPLSGIVESMRVLHFDARLLQKKKHRFHGGRDVLLLSFALYKWVIVGYDRRTRSLTTLAMFSFAEDAVGPGATLKGEKNGRDQLLGPSMRSVACVDPQTRCGAMLIYLDQLVIVPFRSSSMELSFFDEDDDDDDEDDERDGDHDDDDSAQNGRATKKRKLKAKMKKGANKRANGTSGINPTDTGADDVDDDEEEDEEEQKLVALVKETKQRELTGREFLLRLRELDITGRIIDVAFLDGYLEPTLMILHEENEKNSTSGRFAAGTGEDMEPLEASSGFYTSGPTLAAANLFGHHRIVQVFKQGVRVMMEVAEEQNVKHENESDEPAEGSDTDSGPQVRLVCTQEVSLDGDIESGGMNVDSSTVGIVSVDVIDPYILVLLTDGTIRVLMGDDEDMELTVIAPNVRYDDNETNQLTACAFYDAQMYIVSLSVIKDYVMYADVYKSVHFLRWREKQRQLQLLAKDYEPLAITATEYSVAEKKLALLAGDMEENLHVMQFAPQDIESRGGQRLLRTSDFHLGVQITSMIRKATSGSNPPPVSQASANRKQPQDQSRHSQYVTLLGSSEGSVSAVMSVGERVFRRLFTLQNVMINTLPQNCALNPREFRMMKSNGGRRTGRPDAWCKQKWKKGFLDGHVLFRFLHLDYVAQKELARCIGTTPEVIIHNLLEVQRMTASFL
ncbi:hypothetical protein P43SY_004106 [Pythium insidiosum]|uniref:Cleavage/polyadenylation specificity factor A subunit C-terminal domain-containing protein n=1 Tax=Pythium insidiosum TaxID=114742 RepID=A0AAD5Q7N7_PYTIN|nr:hypothetical protein P43SY_004106 [Pythium insidiosum]